ncbi:MAG TPA: universal stress protein [Verrucomicrobiae bacterium]|jgi:nucleotide-binding universal stress UspA family protein
MKLTTRHTRKTIPALTADERALPPIRVGLLKPKKLLVPVDFSEWSEKAVTYAVSLAKHFGSEIVALHVAPMAAPVPSAEFVAMQGVVLDDQLRQDAIKNLEQWRARIADHVTARAMIGSGVSVPEEIVNTARKLRCDLIVIGIHPKGTFEHFLTGSVAEKVVQRATCPVFVVREHQNDFINTRARIAEPKRSVAHPKARRRAERVSLVKVTPA